MSKPLELKVYETDSTGRYMCADGVTYAAEAVNEFADWKRLTDTELAAEYHANEAEAWRMISRCNEFYDIDMAEKLEARESILRRFATSPHYREESA